MFLKKILILSLLYSPFLQAQAACDLHLITLSHEPIKLLETNYTTFLKLRIKFLLDTLTRYGILDPKEDWFDQMTATDPCRGEIMGTLLIRLANAIRNLNTLDAAVTILGMRIGDLQTKYWLSHAIQGEECDLTHIRTLLESIVTTLPTPLPIPPSIYATPLEPIQSEDVSAEYDIIVAGAGSGGCGVAIQAARMGCSVLLLEETDWIGGQITAAGVSTMDEGSGRVQERGLYRELCGHILAYYQPLGINPIYPYGRYCVEPHICRHILHKLLGDAAEQRTLDLLLYTTVTRLLKEGDCVTGVEITTKQGEEENSKIIRSKIVVDATEWGDLLPLTGARYRVGNCTNDAIDMQSKTQALTWTATLKQYPEGVPTELAINTPPPNYEKASRGFKRSLYLGGEEEFEKNAPWSWQVFLGYRAMPNSFPLQQGKSITRTQLNFNNDLHIGVREVEDLKQRQRSCKIALNKTLNLIYYIQSELKKNDWAIANDQGYDTPYQRKQIDTLIEAYPEFAPYRTILYHFSIMPYVRESRRIIGLHTLTAREVERSPGRPIQFPHTIALGDYFIDLHGSKAPKYIELDLDRPEDIPQAYAERGIGPFAIPFECFIPETVDGFLPAEKNISQSRMVNGATRLQPHTLLMGQAVGAIAALSVQQGIQPRHLNPLCVQNALLDAGCRLSIKPLKSTWESPEWKQENLQELYGP